MPNKSQHQKAITAARELCDTLLGINRSSLKEEVKLKFSDREVCKYTLCGICPHTLFNQTKSDLGPSPYSIYGLTNPRLAGPIKEWNSLPQREKDKYGYEYKTMVFLQQLVRKCDQKIENSKKRLEAEERPATMADLNEDDKAKLIDITTKIQKKDTENVGVVPCLNVQTTRTQFRERNQRNVILQHAKLIKIMEFQTFSNLMLKSRSGILEDW